MREIKFRGLVENISTGKREFVYYGVGSKPSLCGMIWIKHDEQFIGLSDKKGKEIYEGDATSNGTIIMWHKDKALFAEFFVGNGIERIASYPIDARDIEII